MHIPDLIMTRRSPFGINAMTRRWWLLFMVFLFSGCATFSESIPELPPPAESDGRSGSGEATHKLLVTAYDPGQRSTDWRHRRGKPVYARGPLKGKRKKVGITADGTKARKGTIAADLSRYPYGTRMHVPGYGWGEVHDIGSAVKGDRIDVFFPTKKEALDWGKKTLEVTVIFPETEA